MHSFMQKALLFAQTSREVVFLNSNSYQEKYHSYDAILAFDAFTSIQTDAFQAFDKLNEYQKSIKDWIFGYLTYDLKNDVEPLTSVNFDGLDFPDLFFFQPQKLVFFKEGTVEFLYLNMCSDEIARDFEKISAMEPRQISSQIEIIQARISKEKYIEKVEKMRHEIQLGNIYEANFCMEFFGENATLDPYSTYWQLNDISYPPFSCFLKLNHHFAISASPERYLKKEQHKVISQPIKGTSKRSTDPLVDLESKLKLQNDQKERAENIMIVDLVRNDLSKTAKKGTVAVEELCKVYTYPQVHQMISTITSEVSETESIAHLLKSTFPMGSMTGAPKVSAMQIIEQLEETKRGLYSGSVGYITPDENFDFNVMIRSILYHQEKKYVSFSVGSAITFPAQATQEYEECLLKAAAMIKVLSC